MVTLQLIVYQVDRLYSPRFFSTPQVNIGKMKIYQRRLVLIAVLAVSPIIIAAFTWRCNSVNLHLKAWNVEYTFEKGACDLVK